MPNNPYYKSQHWKALRSAALRRDKGLCTTAGCGEPAKIVDHIKQRPRVSHPTEFDVLENVRSFCRRCDNQIKELGSTRKGHGKAHALGCTADGTPRDPLHPWHSKP